MERGIFIVVDGTDGSGKKTQTEILTKKLKKEGYDVFEADFPQYGKKSAGLVEEYLTGKYGEAKHVGPYRASIFYACDRYDASFGINKALEEGKIVISNRYAASNMGHQGGKIKNLDERKKFLEWLDNLEYGIFAIPRPDLNIILHVDAAVAQALVDEKGHREYVGGSKRDIHEADIGHLRDAEETFIEITNTFPGFLLIECTQDGKIMDREKISEMVWEAVIKTIDEEGK